MATWAAPELRYSIGYATDRGSEDIEAVLARMIS